MILCWKLKKASVPLTALFKAQDCGRSLGGTAGSNRAGRMKSVCCEGCVLSDRGLGRSLVQRSPTVCGVSENDRETSTMRRPWPEYGCCTTRNIIKEGVSAWIGLNCFTLGSIGEIV